MKLLAHASHVKPRALSLGDFFFPPIKRKAGPHGVRRVRSCAAPRDHLPRDHLQGLLNMLRLTRGRSGSRYPPGDSDSDTRDTTPRHGDGDGHNPMVPLRNRRDCTGGGVRVAVARRTARPRQPDALRSSASQRPAPVYVELGYDAFRDGCRIRRMAALAITFRSSLASWRWCSLLTTTLERADCGSCGRSSVTRSIVLVL